MATELNVAIIALGMNSSDDVRPLSVLARGLKNSNPKNNVRVVTHPQYIDLLGADQIDFFDGGPCPFWARSNTPEGKSLEGKGGGDIGLRLRVFMGMLTKLWFELGKLALETLKPDVVILASTSAMFVYPSLCELLGVKLVVLDNSPLSKTSAFGPPRGFGSSQAGFRHVNLQRWTMHAQSMWSVLYQDGVNKQRVHYGLKEDTRGDGPWSALTDGEEVPVLVAYSEALLPRPLEWSSNIRIIGALVDTPTSSSDEKLPSLFRTFLNGSIGKPVVFISLGVQFNSYRNKASRFKILKHCTTEAVRVGWRCVVVCPSTSGVAPDSLKCVDVHVLGARQATSAMNAIWPHCSMVICAGDPWMVHSTLVHKLPVCVIDFGRDDTSEAFWGGRIEATAVGPAPIPVSSLLGGAAVGQALDSVISPGTIANNAKAISGSMLKKDSASSVVHSVILGILGRAEVSAVTPSPPSSSKTSNKGAEEPTPVPPQPPKNVAKQSSKSAEEVPNNDKRPIAGFSYNHRGATDSNPNATNVWRKGDDGRFRVRIGPNYKKNGKKAPSSQSLYELIAVDLIQSDKRMTDFSQYLRYPSLDLDTHHEGVPQLFIVNGSLPMETPSMMSPASDGKTLNVLFYFAIRPSTCEALANLATAPPAVKLLKEFCTKAPNTPNMFGRFKCIGMARNYDEAGMPSMFKSFNGKPVLVRNCKATKGGSGSLYRGSNFLEMNVNIRMWPYLAKQGLGFLFATSHKVDLDVAFVIEGKDDSELPEVLLGAAQLTKVKLDAAHVWK